MPLEESRIQKVLESSHRVEETVIMVGGGGVSSSSAVAWTCTKGASGAACLLHAGRGRRASTGSF